ncbi:HMG domain-containing protein 4-like [Liolophura sinensis]|uniref:HMG domain-containing protein 4-like n=1 Tax=Liolophura sinensis TaxID=3198878 RepID=UPI0031583511
MDSDGSDPKRGRVRKKSAKLREMEEFEEEERKHGGKKVSDTKTTEGAVGILSPPMKKAKLIGKTDAVGGKPSAFGSPPVPTSPGNDPQARGSVIKLLLSSPVQQSTPAGKTGKKGTNEPVEDVSPVLASGKKAAKVKKTGSGDTEEKNVKLKLQLGSSPPVQGGPEKKGKGVEKVAPLSVDTTFQSEAIGEEGSLKMKFILSPKEKSETTTPVTSGKKSVSVEKASNQGLLSILKGASAASANKKGKKAKQTGSGEVVVAAGSDVKSPSKLPDTGSTGAVDKGSKQTGVKRKLEQTVVVKTNLSSSVEYSLPADHSLEYMDLSSFDFDDDGELVIADENKTKKLQKKTGSKSPKKAKTPPGGSASSSTALNENEFSLDDSQLASSDVAELAKRVKSAAEKKMNKRVKKGKPEKEGDGLQKEKKKRPPTAYMLWCNSYRHKVVAEIPRADFVQISRRLGELWQALSDKEKLAWKNKARKSAGKGSTLISTGKSGGSRTGPPPQVTSHAQSSTSSTAVKTHTPVVSKPRPTQDDSLGSVKGFGTEPVDVAAHLKLVGESLCIIGVRLQEHRGLIAVQGSLSVLLDSMLCACGPLMCLTQQLPELNGCSSQVHAKTLDNVAYIMPGL